MVRNIPNDVDHLANKTLESTSSSVISTPPQSSSSSSSSKVSSHQTAVNKLHSGLTNSHGDTFSPLSSSTITIASLCSSLGGYIGSTSSSNHRTTDNTRDNNNQQVQVDNNSNDDDAVVHADVNANKQGPTRSNKRRAGSSVSLAKKLLTPLAKITELHKEEETEAVKANGSGIFNRKLVQRNKGADAIYGTLRSTDAIMGPVRFQALPRSFASRLGFATPLALGRRRPEDLRFIITPHPIYPEVVEVVDCDEQLAVYRKISRSGKSWRETFHEISSDDEDLTVKQPKVPSDYEMAAFLGLPYPGGLAAFSGYSSYSSRSAIQSMVALNRSEPSTSSLSSSASVTFNRSNYQIATTRTSHTQQPEFNNNGILWEALTPFPNQFPLHIKDTRTVIDTVSLASMVLDRHSFCYRFQMGSVRMKWVARRIRRHQLSMVCMARATVVAEIFVDYEKGYSPYSTAPSVASEEAYPVVTILAEAFSCLCGYEDDVVESFIIFTGMQMLECLHI